MSAWAMIVSSTLLPGTFGADRNVDNQTADDQEIDLGWFVQALQRFEVQHAADDLGNITVAEFIGCKCD